MIKDGALQSTPWWASRIVPPKDAPNVLLIVTDDAGLRVPSSSGGRLSGYGFYLLKGKPVFLWNLVSLERVKWKGPDTLAPGKHALEFDFKYEGLGVNTLAFYSMSGLGRLGTGVLKVDDKHVQITTLPKTLPMILQRDENFDIGSDALTGVNDADYQPPFTLTAKLNMLRLKVDRLQTSRPLKQACRKPLQDATEFAKLRARISTS